MFNSTQPRLGVVMGNPVPPPPCTLQYGYGGAAALLHQVKTGNSCLKYKALASLEILFRDPEQCVAAYKAGMSMPEVFGYRV